MATDEAPQYGIHLDCRADSKSLFHVVVAAILTRVSREVFGDEKNFDRRVRVAGQLQK